ncbi:MAG: VWA domain-containing protein [Chloroflexota bacterium]
MTYSEKPKIAWGAVVVVIAVLLFGCIIAGAFALPRLLQSTTAASPTARPGETASILQVAAPTPAVSSDQASINLLISSANTKEDWMNALVAQFNQEQHKLSSGELINVTVKHVTSGGSQKDILDGKSQPVVWSPGDQSWVDGANQVWRDRTGKVLVSETCPPTILAPIGFAMWRPMAEALGWPDKPISWDDIVKLSADPAGWKSLGHPEWGQFKFGHTHPDYSNAGLLSLAALAYSTIGQTSGITPDQIYSDPVVKAFGGVENNTYHYGIQSRPLMQLLAQRGPDYLHAVTTSEAETLKTNQDFGASMRYQLVFIFPARGTFWTEQPYCILDGDWVSPQQKAAASLFRDYMLARPQQELAIKYYLRPVDESISLHSPLSLVDGTDPRINRSIVPALQSPSADVASAVKDVFHQMKKKASIVLLLDTSGSMEGDKIRNAVASSVNFVKRLDPKDEIFVLGFGGTAGVVDLGGGLAGEVSENLAKSLNGLFASGKTPLYDSVCAALQKIDSIQKDHQAKKENRLYGIVLLSDGMDTASQNTQNQMFACLPTGESADGTKVFTIAYGDDAEKDLMLRIANRTNGKTFTGDPESIESIYNSISAEQ